MDIFKLDIDLIVIYKDLDDAWKFYAKDKNLVLVHNDSWKSEEECNNAVKEMFIKMIRGDLAIEDAGFEARYLA